MPKMSRFAHLLGRRALAEEDDDRDENTEEEDDDKKGKKSKKAKGRKAEDEKDDAAAADDDDDDDDPDADDDSDDPDAEEDDDDKGADDGDDDDEAKSVKQGRRAERNRCARIFGSKYASGNTALAASLAFNTGMSSKQAIHVMASSGVSLGLASAPARVSLDQRMSSVKNHHIGEDKKPASMSTPQGAASAMAALYNRAKGVK